MCVCDVHMCVCTYACLCLQRPEENSGSPGVTGGWELPDVSVRNGNPVSAGAVSALNQRVISLALDFILFKNKTEMFRHVANEHKTHYGVQFYCMFS